MGPGRRAKTAGDRNTTAEPAIPRDNSPASAAGPAEAGPGGFPIQNPTRKPPLAVPIRLWSVIAMPSTAPNSATLLRT